MATARLHPKNNNVAGNLYKRTQETQGRLKYSKTKMQKKRTYKKGPPEICIVEL